MLTAGVNRDNLEICLHRYKWRKCEILVEDMIMILSLKWVPVQLCGGYHSQNQANA